MAENHDTITTAPFAPVEPRTYLGLMVRRMLWRRWWLFAIPIAIMAIGCVADWRVAVIGLMLVFIVYPMAMSLVMLNHALSPALIAKTRTTKATFTNGAIIIAPTAIDYLKRPERPKRLTSLKLAKYPKFPVKSLKTQNGRITIETGRAIADIVLIPQEAFSPKQLSELLNILANELPNQK